MQLPEIQLNGDLKQPIQHEPTPVLSFSPQGIANLTKAITIARPNFGVIKKSAENPFYKDSHGKARKYADLAEIIAATAEPLAEQGLYVFQAPFINDGKTVGITTLLAHSSGEWLLTTITGCPADQKLKEGGSRFDAQTVGIGFTYLARYGMRAILNLGSEDDDGNGLVSQPESKKPLPLAYVGTPKASNIPATASSLSELKNVTVSATNLKVEGQTVATATVDEDGCPLSDVDVPKNLQLPTPEQLKGFVTQIKSLGQDSRLLKQWVEKNAGKEWKQIPFVAFEPIIRTLLLAKDNGTLVEMITPKELAS